MIFDVTQKVQEQKFLPLNDETKELIEYGDIQPIYFWNNSAKQTMVIDRENCYAAKWSYSIPDEPRDAFIYLDSSCKQTIVTGEIIRDYNTDDDEYSNEEQLYLLMGGD